MDYAGRLDFMDDDCDIEGFPLDDLDDQDEIEETGMDRECKFIEP